MTLENNYNIKSLTTPAATGGTVTTTATHRIHIFTSSETFTANKTMNVEALVVAGGGGGGTWYGGGGGAGGLLYNNSSGVSSQTYSVTVGNGGAIGTNGNNSIFGSLTAIGGGCGGSYSSYSSSIGGSGGGGSILSQEAGSAGTTGQGYAGGSGQQGGIDAGGGGGGAGGAGANGIQLSNGGAGGIGSNNFKNSSTSETTAFLLAANAGIDISGTRYIAGGGGGGYGSTGGGAGGAGGGGAGGVNHSGSPNTGGGGGGVGYNNPSAGSGGSGIVIISYPLSQDILSPASITATSMTVSSPSESPCRAGICTVGVSVTWTNNGESTGSFVPSLTVSSGTVTPTYSSEPLAAGAYVVHTFTISNMTAGTCSICPNPN